MENECNEPPLPQEIFDLIIDQISLRITAASTAVDRRALVNCSLVSRNFRVRSLRHIFSRVLIEADAWPPVQDTSPTIKRWNDFLDIVGTNPAIATMVQTLTIRSLSSNCVEEQPAWIWTIPPLPRVLRSLTHIQTFSLDESGLEWNTLPLGVASALVECISCPLLRTLKMKEVCAFPPRALLGCKSLTSLGLSRISWDDPSTYIQCSELRDFRVSFVEDMEREDVVRAWRIISQAPETLERLGMKLPPCDDELWEGVFDLSCMRSLREAILYCTLDRTPQFPVFLLHLFRLERCQSYIGKLDIIVVWERRHLGNEKALFEPGIGWDSLDGILADDVMYPCLKLIKFGFLFALEPSYCAPSQVAQQTRALLDDLFPRVRARNVAVEYVVLPYFVM